MGGPIPSSLPRFQRACLSQKSLRFLVPKWVGRRTRNRKLSCDFFDTVSGRDLATYFTVRYSATMKRKSIGNATATFLRYLEAADAPAGSVETCGPCRQYVAEACGHPGLRPLITPTCELYPARARIISQKRLLPRTRADRRGFGRDGRCDDAARTLLELGPQDALM